MMTALATPFQLISRRRIPIHPAYMRMFKKSNSKKHSHLRRQGLLLSILKQRGRMHVL
jgi:hypothetical protein